MSLKSAGVKTGDKKENAVFTRVDRLASSAIHAEGFYPAAGGEKKAYLHIGPKFGTVSKRSVEDAVRECRQLSPTSTPTPRTHSTSNPD